MNLSLVQQMSCIVVLLFVVLTIRAAIAYWYADDGS